MILVYIVVKIIVKIVVNIVVNIVVKIVKLKSKATSGNWYKCKLQSYICSYLGRTWFKQMGGVPAVEKQAAQIYRKYMLDVAIFVHINPYIDVERFYTFLPFRKWEWLRKADLIFGWGVRSSLANKFFLPKGLGNFCENPD